MTSLRELKTDEEFEKWGIKDALRETQLRQRSSRPAGKFEFIVKGSRRRAIPSTCSLTEHALNKYVMQLVSKSNSASYLLESVNYASASTDFRKLMGFLDEYPEPGKSELATLVFPVFVYFYLLLLQSGPTGILDAKAFYKKNKAVFEDEESYAAVLEALFSFNNWADVKKNSYFKNFLECKYVVGICPDVLGDLKNFIQNDAQEEGDKALLYVLHFHIHFQDVDEAEYIDSTTDTRMPILKGDGYEWVELEDPPASEPMNVDEHTSVAKPTENQAVPNTNPTITYTNPTITYTNPTIIHTNPTITHTNRTITHTNPTIPNTNLTIPNTNPTIPNTNLTIPNTNPTTNRPPVPPKSSNTGNIPSKPKDGEPETELDSLLTLMTLNHPRISTVVTRCLEGSICSVDFNEGESEMAYAIGDDNIYIVMLGKVEEVIEKEVIEEDIDPGPGPSKRKRVSERRVNIPSKPQRRGSKTKTVKTGRSGRNSKPPRGTKRKKETKPIEVEIPTLDRNLKAHKLPGTGDTVHIVKYLPGRPFFLLAACRFKVRVLNTLSDCFVGEYETHKGLILDIDINKTAQYFATAHIDLVTCLFNFDWSWQIQTYVGHVDAVTCVRFHPNGIYIATGSEDSTVRLYDVDSGLCIRRFSDYSYGISAMAFSPNGQFLASADVFGDVRVWNIKDGSEISTLKFGKVLESLGKISSVCFHSDSVVIMACNLKGECRMWDIRKPVEEGHILNFRNRPLKIKYSTKKGKWKMALQEEVLNYHPQ